MKLIAGLGNPGRRYRETYHNAGFAVVDRVAERHGVQFEGAPAEAMMARARGVGGGLLLVKPLTFMNLSGVAVAELQRYFKVALADLLVVFDDVALPMGRLRVRRRGSAGGHNGLGSVIEALGSADVPRLRIGVGRGDPRRDLAHHVLSRVEADERAAFAEAIERAADAVETFVLHGIEQAMNQYNVAPDEAGSQEPEVENRESGIRK